MFKKKCPKCKSKDLTKIKASFRTQASRVAVIALVPPLALFMGFKKPHFICNECSLEWDDR